MEWELKTIDLGTIKQKVKQEVIFKVKEGEALKKISSLNSSCGCSKPKWNKDKRQIEVAYTPGSVPKHLLNQGNESYKSSKVIYVMYEDKTNDVLNFTAIVTI